MNRLPLLFFICFLTVQGKDTFYHNVDCPHTVVDILMWFSVEVSELIRTLFLD